MKRIWPFNVIGRLKRENEQLKETIESLNIITQDLTREKENLKVIVVQAAKSIKQKEKEYKLALQILKMQNLNN